MLVNTDWKQVSRLVVYDDGSTDGTLQFLADALDAVPVTTEMRGTSRLGPVGITNDYLRRDAAEVFAKIDNDTMLPPDWLPQTLDIFERDNLDLLGIECRGAIGRPDHAEPTKFIGGIGLMRKRAFNSLPIPDGIHFGFTRWQDEHPNLRNGWLEPSLPVCLLNMVPFSPWTELSVQYVDRGWQRHCGRYPETHKALWEWWA